MSRALLYVNLLIVILPSTLYAVSDQIKATLTAANNTKHYPPIAVSLQPTLTSTSAYVYLPNIKLNDHFCFSFFFWLFRVSKFIELIQWIRPFLRYMDPKTHL